MKQKLLYAFIILLLVVNSVLIYMVIKKPHEKRNQPNRTFLTTTLGFSSEQNEAFRTLDEKHKDKMRQFDKQIRRNKDLLFNSFENKTINFEEITKRIGDLEGKKEAELFRFFTKVRLLCTQKQKEIFDKIIQKALHEGKPRPPEDGRRPPKHNDKNYPPR